MLGRLLFSAGTLANGEFGFSRRLRETSALEWASPDEGRSHTTAKLGQAIAYAVSNVPWYRSLKGLVADTNDPWTALRSFPEISKATLQSSSGDLRSLVYRGRVIRKTTGGSTGQPVTVFKDPAAVSFERAASWSFYRSYGLEIGDKCVRFWGSPTTANRALRAQLADLASNRITLSAFGIGATELDAHWKRCVTAQAPFFYGYSSMLAAFADHLSSHDLDGTRTGVKVIVSTSEVLTDSYRMLLDRVFHATVRDEYGCGEFGPIAYECEAGLLHVAGNNVVAEVITPDGRNAEVGESGRLLITDLNNRAMPLIRFAIGDNAERGGPCTCGRSGETLRRVWGREYDFIELSDGRRYHGEFLMYLFEDLAGQGLVVNQFQVIQERDRSVEIRIVGDGEEAYEKARRVEVEARKRLGGLDVSCVVVRSIERRASGKTSLIIRRG